MKKIHLVSVGRCQSTLQTAPTWRLLPVRSSKAVAESDWTRRSPMTVAGWGIAGVVACVCQRRCVIRDCVCSPTPDVRRPTVQTVSPLPATAGYSDMCYGHSSVRVRWQVLGLICVKLTIACTAGGRGWFYIKAINISNIMSCSKVDQTIYSLRNVVAVLVVVVLIFFDEKLWHTQSQNTTLKANTRCFEYN